MKTCKHCEQEIVRCPHQPARFCRGWRHAAIGAVVISHFCGGDSNSPLAEPELPVRARASS